MGFEGQCAGAESCWMRGCFVGAWGADRKGESTKLQIGL